MSEDRTLVDGGKWLASTLRTEGQRERAMLVEGLYDHIVALEAGMTGLREMYEEYQRLHKDALGILTDEIKRLTEGAKSLCDQLDVVNNDPEYLGVFQLSQAHGSDYTGAKFYKGLVAMRLILSQTPGEKP